MPTITHPNGQVTYYEDDNFTDPWKPHETILIQHGFARHSAFWYHWIPALSRHYRVIRRDARGHGRSSAPSTSYDYTAKTILEEIVDTLDQLKLDRVHWLGESTGGIWGEAMAVEYPERLLSLTTCATPMNLPPEALTSLSFGYDSVPKSLRIMGSHGWAVEAAKLLKTDQISSDYTKWWIEQVSMPSGDALADHAELALEKVDARQFVNRIEIPMLILAPSNSTLARLDGDDNQYDLQKRVKGSQLMVIEGKGHEIYIDEAEKCRAAFLKFLGSLSS